MSVIFDDKYIDNYYLEDSCLNNDLYKIIEYIKKYDYEKALILFKEKNFSFNNIISRSQKLKAKQLSSFIDYVILNK